MKRYAEWNTLLNEAPNIPATPMGRAATNAWNVLSGRPKVNWSQAEQQQQTDAQRQQKQSQLNDPTVKQQKYTKLLQLFRSSIGQYIKLGGPAAQQVDHSLDNIAQAFTIGHQVRGSDLHNILVAIHTAKRVRPNIKSETFGDHHRLLSFLRQVFDQNPDTWFDPDARRPEQQFAPRTSINASDIAHYYEPWKESPLRFRAQAGAAASKAPASAKMPSESPNNVPGGSAATAVDAALELTVGYPGNVPQELIQFIARRIYDKAKADGNAVEYGDERELLDRATSTTGAGKKQRVKTFHP